MVILQASKATLKINGQEVTTLMSAQMDVRCRFCERKLRTPATKAKGYGPVCARKNKQILEFEANEKAGQERLPGVMEVEGAAR